MLDRPIALKHARGDDGCLFLLPYENFLLNEDDGYNDGDNDDLYDG